MDAKELLNWLRHNIMFLFSADYRWQEKLRRGNKVWDEVTKDLPPFTGENMDSPEAKFHFTSFKGRLLMLSEEDETALHAWLIDIVHDLTYNFTELTSATIERIEQEKLTEYRTHLEAVKEFEASYPIT